MSDVMPPGPTGRTGAAPPDAALLERSRAQPLAADLDAFHALLSPVILKAGAVLHEPGEAVRDLYVIGSAAAAACFTHANGDSVGGQLFSRGDLVGLPAMFEASSARAGATVLVSGTAWRCEATALQRLCHDRPGLTQALAGRLALQLGNAQIDLACCVHHSVEQRLARLLLDIARRLRSDHAPVTQEQLALLLGVQRTTISALAGRLKSAKIIAYVRGSVRIADPAQLEAVACRCRSLIADSARWLPTAPVDDQRGSFTRVR